MINPFNPVDDKKKNPFNPVSVVRKDYQPPKSEKTSDPFSLSTVKNTLPQQGMSIRDDIEKKADPFSLPAVKSTLPKEGMSVKDKTSNNRGYSDFLDLQQKNKLDSKMTFEDYNKAIDAVGYANFREDIDKYSGVMTSKATAGRGAKSPMEVELSKYPLGGLVPIKKEDIINTVTAPIKKLPYGESTVRGFREQFEMLPANFWDSVNSARLRATTKGGLLDNIIPGVKLPGAALRDIGKDFNKKIFEKTGIDEDIGDFAIKRSKSIRNDISNRYPSEKTTGDNFARGLGGAVASFAQSLAIGFLTGSPQAAGAVFGLQAEGRGTREALEAGADTRKALNIGTIKGTGEALLEAWGVDGLINETGTFLVRALKSSIREGIQETSQSLFSGGVDFAFNMKDFNLDNVVDLVIESVVSGLTGMIIGGGGGITVGAVQTQSVTKQLQEAGVPRGKAKEMAKSIMSKALDTTEKITMKSVEELRDVSNLTKDMSVPGSGVIADATELNQRPTSQQTPSQIKDNTLYHGSDAGKLKIDGAGNVNFGIDSAVERFGPLVKVDTSNLNFKNYDTKDAMFYDANNPDVKQRLIDDGIDVLISDNHAIGINTDKIAQESGLNFRESRLDRPIGELVEEYKAQVETTPEKRSLFEQESIQPQKETQLFGEESIQERILKAKDEFQREQMSNLNPPPVIEFPNEVESVRQDMMSSKLTDNIEDYKDIPNIKVQFRDFFRNTDQVFGKDSKIAEQIIIEPLLEAKDNNIKFLQSAEAELSSVTDIGRGSKKSKYMQMFGEGKVTFEELVNKFGEKEASKIAETEKFLRDKYDKVWEILNFVEQSIYPNSPHKWTPKRKNYHRHGISKSNEISKLNSLLQNPIKIDPMLVGKTEDTKPKSRWASFKQRRKTDNTNYDAIGNYINYVESLSYAINIDPYIGRLREFGEILRRGTWDSKNLNNYIQNVENLANELSGKTPQIDRAVMEHIPGGRTGLKVMSWANRRAKKNTILGNARSSLVQIYNVPQGLADAGPINSIKGLNRSMADILFENKAMKESRFLNERTHNSFSKFDKGIFKSSKKFAAWMVGALDEVGTKIIWNAEYQKALSNGVENPIEYADKKARNMVGGRGIAEKPTVQNSEVFQLVAPFQYEMTNVWFVMEDMLKENKPTKGIGKLLAFFFYSWIFNEAAEKAFGDRPILDPIDAIADGVREFRADKSTTGALKGTARVAGEALSNLPGGNFIATNLTPEYGGDFLGVEIPSRRALFGEGDPTRYGQGLLSAKALQDPLFKMAPSYGGGQLKKTLQGLAAMSAGESRTKDGKLQYKIDDNLRNYITAILFGKYALPEARDYYDKSPESKKKKSAPSGNPFNPR